MSDFIRLGIIGAGIYARNAHLPALLNLQDRFQTVAVYSRTPANAASLAAEFPDNVAATDDINAILERDDIDAVDILLPIHLMPDVVEAALKAGKHVLSEKPIAPDMTIGFDLLRTWAQYPDLVWMVGEQWRYEEAIVKATAMIQAGELGTLVMAQWSTFNNFSPGNPYYETEWRRQVHFTGGQLLDGGVHRVAAMRMMLGEVDAVSAFVRRRGDDLKHLDTMVTNLVCRSGVLANYSATYVAGAWVVQPMTVTGSKATLHVERSLLEVVRDGYTERISITPHMGVQHELVAFADAIQHGTPHLNTPQEALRDVAVIEAALQSAQTNCAVIPERVS